jgi:hypothetical protein
LDDFGRGGRFFGRFLSLSIDVLLLDLVVPWSPLVLSAMRPEYNRAWL